MNRIPMVRRRAAARIASATAVAVGAALLAAPGAAEAQTDGIDCAALGDHPSAPGTEAALEIAVACGVEVAVEKATTVYDAYYATPEGQLHQVSTAASAGMLQAQGSADPTLAETDGGLVQTDSQWPFTLSAGGDQPLLRTDAASLLWEGGTPTPVRTGAQASYDELAPGLDLTMETRVSSLGMRFTVQDAEAWESLATGLTLDAVVGAGNELRETLYLAHPSDYYESGTWEQTTRFHLRDDAGAGQSLGLTIEADGTLALAPAEGTIGTAAFPLTVTAQWAYHQLGINEWGSVTSAASDLVVFRGDGGLEEPYFAAAGQEADAVVGPYCDLRTDPECTAPAEAATYWNFWGPIEGDVMPSAPGIPVNLPVAKASFQVDAAEGAECVAPELRTTTLYRLNQNWGTRSMPAGTRPAATGACQDGTAVYDLSGWISSTGGFPGPAFGMVSSTETARFDGSSARLDVYWTFSAYDVNWADCRDSASDPAKWSNSKVPYGGFTAEIWRPDLVDQA